MRIARTHKKKKQQKNQLGRSVRQPAASSRRCFTLGSVSVLITNYLDFKLAHALSSAAKNQWRDTSKDVIVCGMTHFCVCLGFVFLFSRSGLDVWRMRTDSFLTQKGIYVKCIQLTFFFFFLIYPLSPCSKFGNFANIIEKERNPPPFVLKTMNKLQIDWHHSCHT